MNSRIFAAFLVSLLMVTGLNAQEISTSPAKRQDQQEGMVAPDAAAVVLEVPVRLKAIAPGVNAFVQCWISFDLPDGDRGRSRIHQLIPLTQGGYAGVMSMEFRGSELENLIPGNLTQYHCILVFCGNNVEGTPGNTEFQYLPGGNSHCNRPYVYGPSWNLSSYALAADPDMPFTVAASVILQD